jgi:hypothetical protein
VTYKPSESFATGQAASGTAPDEPLSLTVHTMPGTAGQGAGASAGASAVSGRWKMLAVLLVCVAPIVASYFAYYVVRPDGRRNFGDLINPQKPLPPMATRSLDGKVGQLPALKGQWLLITVASGACNAGCQQNLYLQRQLRESLGKEKERLDRVWLVPDDAAVAPALLPALAGASVLRVPAQELDAWLQPAAGQLIDAHMYLVDPLGNWMMRFPANMDTAAAGKAKRDLDRLLRAASSWDTEGRP